MNLFPRLSAWLRSRRDAAELEKPDWRFTGHQHAVPCSCGYDRHGSYKTDPQCIALTKRKNSEEAYIRELRGLHDRMVRRLGGG